MLHRNRVVAVACVGHRPRPWDRDRARASLVGGNRGSEWRDPELKTAAGVILAYGRPWGSGDSTQAISGTGAYSRGSTSYSGSDESEDR